MANKKLTIDLEVIDNIDDSLGNLRMLKKELRAVAAGSEEFNIIKQRINDMEDALKSANTGAGNFAEIVGQLPGPVGELGNKVGGAINTLKQFGGLKLDALKNSFSELGKDIGDIFKGFGQLTGITKAYTTLNNSLASSFVKVGVGEEAAAAGARTLSTALIATGIGALIVVLGIAASKLYELATGEEAAAAAAKKLNEELDNQNELLELNAKDTARRNKIELAELKAKGASAKEIRDLQYKQAKEAYETAYADEQEAVKIYNANLGKADAEGLKKLQENLDKRQQATKDAYANAKEIGLNNKAEELKEEEAKNKELAAKRKTANDKKKADDKKAADDRLKDIEAAGKAETDAFKDTLTAREKELYEAGQVANERLAAIDKAGTGDRNLILEAFRKKQQEINEKYDKEDAEKAKEKAKKKADEEREAAVVALEGLISDLDYANQLQEDDFAQDIERLQQKKELQMQERDVLLSNEELTAAERLKIQQDYAQKDRDVEKQITDTKKAEIAARQAIQLQYVDYVQQLGALLGQIAGKNKGLAIAGIIIEQGAALAKVIMSVQTANAAALATPQAIATSGAAAAPVILRNNIQGALSSAAIIAGAAKSIAQINSANVDSKSGGGGSASASPSLPAYSSGGVSMASPQLQLAQQATPGQQIAQTIGAAQNRPVRAYVVSSDISNQQALDRRANKGATFSLG